MRNIKNTCILFFLVFFSSCIFSNNNEGVKLKISNCYSILVFSSGNQLMYKKDVDMIGEAIVLKDVDSLAWNRNYILAFSHGKYFIIKQSEGEKIQAFSEKRNDLINYDNILSMNLESVASILEKKKVTKK